MMKRVLSGSGISHLWRVRLSSRLSLLAGLGAVSLAPATRADTSAWSSKVATVAPDDSSAWCTPQILVDGSGLSYATGKFRRIATSGTVLNDPYTNPNAALQVKMQCFQNQDFSGTTSTVTSPVSTDAGGDIVQTPKCPAGQKWGGFARCQISTAQLPPYVYSGTNCGAGLTGVTGPGTMQGEMTGDHYELDPVSPPPPFPPYPLYNNTSINGGINGTDLGYQFLAQGQMYVGFGDSWQFEGTIAGPLDPRGSILYRTTDFNPSDGNGILFTGWESVPGNPSAAREVIPATHDTSGNSEWTAIAGSGLGFTEGSTAYRVLWFVSVKTWVPTFVSNDSSIAWSVGTGNFVRGDKQPLGPPVWAPDTFFGVGAIWVDRENGYTYLFGMKTYNTSTPIRVARVRTTFAAITDRRQYQYWNGSTWVTDTNGDYSPAKLPSPAPDLIQNRSPRPEFSVTYNSYSGTFFMMFVDYTTAANIEIWQAPAVTGPWTQVGSYPPAFAGMYGTYTSEQLMRNGGQDFYFMMSEWNNLPAPFGQPYNVGLWKGSFTRNLLAHCTPF